MVDLNDLQQDWDSQPTYSKVKINKTAMLVRSRSDPAGLYFFCRRLSTGFVFRLTLFRKRQETLDGRRRQGS